MWSNDGMRTSEARVLQTGGGSASRHPLPFEPGAPPPPAGGSATPTGKPPLLWGSPPTGVRLRPIIVIRIWRQ